MMRPRRLRDQSGSSVMEALVSLALGSIVLAGLHTFSQAQLKSMQSQATQISVQSVARAMLEVVARDLRRGGLDPTCSKAFEGISVAKVDEVRIQSDLDASGSINGGEEDVAYRYNHATSSVDRISGGTTNALLEGIALDGSSLRYFDSAGLELNPGSSGLSAAQRQQVRRIRIQIALADAAPDRDAPMRARVATDVDLRNRYFLTNTECP